MRVRRTQGNANVRPQCAGRPATHPQRGAQQSRGRAPPERTDNMNYRVGAMRLSEGAGTRELVVGAMSVHRYAQQQALAQALRRNGAAVEVHCGEHQVLARLNKARSRVVEGHLRWRFLAGTLGYSRVLAGTRRRAVLRPRGTPGVLRGTPDAELLFMQPHCYALLHRPLGGLIELGAAHRRLALGAILAFVTA